MKLKTGDYLPLSYKTRLVVPEVNKEILKKYGIKSFILDSELLPQYDQIYNMKDGTEVVADTQLSLVTSILGSLDDLSHKIQETNPIKFTVFDIVMINGVWLDENNYNKTIETLKTLRDNMKITNEEFEAKERAYKEYFSCKNRIKTLEKVYTILKGAGLNNYIDRPKTTMVNKDDFYNNILAQGGEGVVAKDLNSLYETEGRRRGAWCVNGDTQILLENGSTKSIQEIVENKIKCNVMSYNFETNQLEAKPIINWFDNGIKPIEDWTKLRVFNKRDSHSKNYNGLDYSSLVCTKTHKLYKGKYEIDSKDLCINDEVLAYHYNLTDFQKQIILGMILGDGCLGKNKKGEYTLSWCQSKMKHHDYYNYIRKCFGNQIGKTYERISGFGSIIEYFLLRKTKLIQDFLARYYQEGSPAQCNLDKVLEDLDDIGVAQWIMDDGSGAIWRSWISYLFMCIFR